MFYDTAPHCSRRSRWNRCAGTLFYGFSNWIVPISFYGASAAHRWALFREELGVKDAVLCGPAVCSDGLCGRLDSRLRCV